MEGAPSISEVEAEKRANITLFLEQINIIDIKLFPNLQAPKTFKKIFLR